MLNFHQTWSVNEWHRNSSNNFVASTERCGLNSPQPYPRVTILRSERPRCLNTYQTVFHWHGWSNPYKRRVYVYTPTDEPVVLDYCPALSSTLTKSGYHPENSENPVILWSMAGQPSLLTGFQDLQDYQDVVQWALTIWRGELKRLAAT